MDDKEFTKRFGAEPEMDDLERVNCDVEHGKPGHFFCGVCPTCDKPRFMCGHPATPIGDVEIPKLYRVAGSFVIERRIRIEANDAEQAARIAALDRPYPEWHGYRSTGNGDDIYAEVMVEEPMAVETDVGPGLVEQTWVYLKEDADGQVEVDKVEGPETLSTELPYNRYRRQWPTPKDNEDIDDEA